MTADPLAWRVERACAAAYPPRQAAQIGDWAVALSDGGSRRSNSASAILPGAALDAATLTAIRDHFSTARQPAIVRVTDLTPDIDDLLDRNGFAPREGETRTLLRHVAPHARTAPAGIVLTDAPDPVWLATRRRLPPSAEDPAQVAARIAPPTGYARRGDVAIGYAALHGDIAVIEAIATDPAAHRKGHARAIVTGLIDWAARAGASHLTLQVEATNVPARALYAQAGFTADLYGYHYRRITPSSAPDR